MKKSETLKLNVKNLYRKAESMAVQATDIWQGLTPMQRYEISQKVPQHFNTMKCGIKIPSTTYNFRECLIWIIDNMLDGSGKPVEVKMVVAEPGAQWKYTDYSEWARSLAASCSRKEIQKMLSAAGADLTRSVQSHLRAIQKTGSMQGNSGARAMSRNCVEGAGEKKRACENALEIYRFYPERTKEGTLRCG